MTKDELILAEQIFKGPPKEVKRLIEIREKILNLKLEESELRATIMKNLNIYNLD